MFNLKKFIASQIMSLKVVKYDESKITFKNSKLLDILKEKKEYEFLIIKALMINKNICKVNFLYDDKLVEINYNNKEINKNNVEEWVNIVLATILDNYDIIRNALENKEYINDMVDSVESQLIDKLKEIN